MDSNMETLISQLQTHPQKRQKVLVSLEVAIMDFFNRKFEESGGEITPEMIAIADHLYNYPVVKTLADALRVKPGQLKKLLGKKISINCSKCDAVIEYFEVRTKEHSNRYYNDICADCQKKIREKREREEEEMVQAWVEAEKYRIQIDTYLYHLSTEAALGMGTVREFLEKYGRCWAEEIIYGYFRGIDYDEYYDCKVKIGTGCMVCGKANVYAYLTNECLIQPGSFADDLRVQLRKKRTQRRYRDRDKPQLVWPPLDNVLQLLWRLSRDPEDYFEQAVFYPLHLRPLLMLCQDDIALASHTHFSPYPDMVFS